MGLYSLLVLLLNLPSLRYTTRYRYLVHLPTALDGTNVGDILMPVWSSSTRFPLPFFLSNVSPLWPCPVYLVENLVFPLFHVPLLYPKLYSFLSAVVPFFAKALIFFLSGLACMILYVVVKHFNGDLHAKSLVFAPKLRFRRVSVTPPSDFPDCYFSVRRHLDPFGVSLEFF